MGLEFGKKHKLEKIDDSIEELDELEESLISHLDSDVIRYVDEKPHNNIETYHHDIDQRNIEKVYELGNNINNNDSKNDPYNQLSQIKEELIALKNNNANNTNTEEEQITEEAGGPKLSKSSDEDEEQLSSLERIDRMLDRIEP